MRSTGPCSRDSGRRPRAKEVARAGLVLDVAGEPIAAGLPVALPRLADLHTRRGFTIDLVVRFDELTAGQTILDTRDKTGKGILLSTSDRSTLRLTLGDGRTQATWDSDPGTGPGTLRVGHWHHITVIVDGGPKIITFLVDGILNDGGAVREYGWGRFPRDLGDVNGTRCPAREYPARPASRFRIYDRALRTSEAVGNSRG